MNAASASPHAGKKSGKPAHPGAARALYKFWNIDKLRLTDVDHQHHVNNAIFAVLYTSVRADFLHAHVRPLIAESDMFAMVKITIEYLTEMHYPGEVEVGIAETAGSSKVGIAVRRVGSSSITFGQAMYKDGKCASVAEAVMVLLDPVTRRAKPLPDGIAARLAPFTEARA